MKARRPNGSRRTRDDGLSQQVDDGADVLERVELLQRCESLLRLVGADALRLARAVRELALQIVPRERAARRARGLVDAYRFRAAIAQAHLDFDVAAAAGAALFEIGIVAAR